MKFLFNRNTKKYSSKLNSSLNYHRRQDRYPPWINNRVKELINEKNDTYYLHSNKDHKLFNKGDYLQNEFKYLIEASKEKYYSRDSKRKMNLSY